MNKDLFVGAYVLPMLNDIRYGVSNWDYAYAEWNRLCGMIDGAHLLGVFSSHEKGRLYDLAMSAINKRPVVISKAAAA